MTMHEFANVVNHAMRYNGPFVTRLAESPVVKYIHPSIDLRFNNVFAISFRGFGGGRILHCQNECRDLPDSLHDRCMKYLRGEETQ